ncbi:MAG TPA: hypothetical protein VIV82_12530 [Verrucomicrobiae bacterium]
MNAFIRKEIRSLAPGFTLALASALSLWLLPQNLDRTTAWYAMSLPMLFLCPMLGLLMCLEAFGREMTSGMFASLLVQPISRGRIWWCKTLLLLLAVAVLLAAWCLTIVFAPNLQIRSGERSALLFRAVMTAVTFYSGALWTVLLLRHVGVAFWITLLAPMELVIPILSRAGDKHPESLTAVIGLVLMVYSIAGFLFAWRLFLRAQDLEWTSATIQFPKGQIFSRLFGRFRGKRSHRPFRAILLREFQFHQSLLIIAGGLAVLHLCANAVRTFGHGLEDHSAFEFVLNQFWMLWLFMPLLIGGAAVADERKMGTLEGELCLPVRQITQFAVKFLVVIGHSLLLGFGMPLLLEGSRILPVFPWNHLKFLPAAAFGLAAIALGAAAFFFSTLSRNTLQALGPTLLGVFLFAFLFVNGWEPEKLVDYRLWHGLLGYLIGIPLMTATLAALAYWNYKRVLVGATVWRRNLLMSGFTMIVTVGSATAIYHRVWELAMPLEPTHGAARLQTAEIVEGSPGSCVVKLPNGRVWASRYDLSSGRIFLGLCTYKTTLSGESFLPGSNWISIAPCWMDLVGIQQNGSLWVSAKPLPSLNSDSTEEKPDFTLKQFGDDHEWKKAVAYGRTALLLNQDGSLWKLGENRSKGAWPGLMHFEPERISGDSDWTDIIQLGWLYALQRKDGRIYSSDLIGPGAEDSDHVVVAGDLFVRATNLEGHHWRDVFYLFPPGSPMCLAGIRDDGGFGILLERQELGKRRKQSFEKKEIQFGTRKDWLATAAKAVGDNQRVVTLAKDGTLWHWIFSEESPYKPRPVQLGTHSDWIAIADAPDGILSLAADGSLWLWMFDGNKYEIKSRSDRFSLLQPSRRPQFMGNIFAETGK